MDPTWDCQTAIERHDWKAAARICEQELGDLEKAIEYRQRAFGVDTGDSDTLDALERLYTATARWAELAGLLEHRLEANPGKDKSLALLRSLLSVYRDLLGDEAAAATTEQRLVEKSK